MRLDKPALAIPEIRAALDSDTDGRLYYQLARAYQMFGETQLASEMIFRRRRGRGGRRWTRI